MSWLKGPITIAALLSLLLMIVAPTVWARPPTLLAAMAKGDGATAATPKQDAAAGPAHPWKMECPQAVVVHKCNGAAASINKPICGVSEAGMLRSFTNRCYFELHNCMSKGTWVVLHDGPC